MPRTMRFSAVPVNIAGQSDQNRSVPVNAQRTLGMYPEKVSGGVNGMVLHSFPGLLTLSDNTPASDRGAHVFNNVLYVIQGTTLYSVNSIGVRTSVGTITGSGPCSMENNGAVMVICNGSTPYSYDGTTLSSLSAITFNPKVVKYLNNQFIFDGDDGRLGFADAGTTTVGGTSYLTPESSPDALVAQHVFNQVLWAFGSNSAEPYENTGTGTPPFERINGGIIEDIGLSSPYAVTNTEIGMYFMDISGTVYRVQAFQAIPITSSGQSYTFAQYTLSDCIAMTFNMDGQKFVKFDFPTDGKTWVFSEEVGAWFELDRNGDRYLAGAVIESYGGIYGVGYADGNIYKLDYDTYTDDGETITRERVFSVISGSDFGVSGASLEMSKLRIMLETGTGTNDGGQGDNPQIMVQSSIDGGRTWGSEQWIEIGRLGAFDTVVEYHNMMVFRMITFRIRFTDPARLTLFNASLDVREAGY